jgi:hypothetical protein
MSSQRLSSLDKKPPYNPARPPSPKAVTSFNAKAHSKAILVLHHSQQISSKKVTAITNTTPNAIPDNTTRKTPPISKLKKATTRIKATPPVTTPMIFLKSIFPRYTLQE